LIIFVCDKEIVSSDSVLPDSDEMCHTSAVFILPSLLERFAGIVFQLSDVRESYSLFTPPTWTRQNHLVLSCSCRRCKHSWLQDKTFVCCIDPVSSLQLFSLKCVDDYWNLGLGRDKRKLSCVVSSCVHTADAVKTRQCCLVCVSGV